MNKKHKKIYIGTSARRQLVLCMPRQVALLNFTADGPYEALLASDSAALPEEQLVLSGSGWLRIYDDEELTFLAWADKIRVYADGDNTCKVQLIGDARVQKMVLMQQVTRKLQNLVDQMAAQK